jgi:hypothetical protein
MIIIKKRDGVTEQTLRIHKPPTGTVPRCYFLLRLSMHTLLLRGSSLITKRNLRTCFNHQRPCAICIGYFFLVLGLGSPSNSRLPESLQQAAFAVYVCWIGWKLREPPLQRKALSVFPQSVHPFLCCFADSSFPDVINLMPDDLACCICSVGFSCSVYTGCVWVISALSLPRLRWFEFYCCATRRTLRTGFFLEGSLILQFTFKPGPFRRSMSLYRVRKTA